MTDMIFPQEDRDLKLTCTLTIESYSLKPRYLFKLHQREKRKRKWKEIQGYEGTYRVTTDMKDILKFLTWGNVLALAELEYKKYLPTKDLFNE